MLYVFAMRLAHDKLKAQWSLFPSNTFAFPYKSIGMQNTFEADQMQDGRRSLAYQMHLLMSYLSSISTECQTISIDACPKPIDTGSYPEVMLKWIHEI